GDRDVQDLARRRGGVLGRGLGRRTGPAGGSWSLGHRGARHRPRVEAAAALGARVGAAPARVVVDAALAALDVGDQLERAARLKGEQRERQAQNEPGDLHGSGKYTQAGGAWPSSLGRSALREPARKGPGRGKASGQLPGVGENVAP